MFNDNDIRELIEELLEVYSFEELLEINDLTEADALEVLFRAGWIVQPERVLMYDTLED